MTYEDFLAAELYMESTAASVLTKLGLKVASPFVRVLGQSPSGDPITEPLPDDACTVLFTFTKLDSDTRIFIVRNGQRLSMAGAIEGQLEISHAVPVASPDGAPLDLAGVWPSCYPRLCRQRGLIRCAFAEDLNPFRDLLPAIDRVSIDIVQPERGVDTSRTANTAIERFQVRIIPALGQIT